MGNDDPLPIRNLLLILAFLFNAVFLVGYTPEETQFLYQIPETITVRITGIRDCRNVSVVRYTTTEVDFKEYVKGVLPNEWGPDWPDESLMAGAIAIKMFAWSHQVNKGYVWDCNWDQVYDPSRRKEKTDQAVDATWEWLIWDEGPVRTHYDNWPAACYSRGDIMCMPQWSTLRLANEGMTFQQILSKYYDGELVFTDVGSTRISVCNDVIQVPGVQTRIGALIRFELYR